MRTKNPKLLEWLKTATDQDVARTGTTRGYLRQVGYGNKQASAALASLLERETNGEVSRKSLRPGDWSLIWPELDSAA